MPIRQKVEFEGKEMLALYRQYRSEKMTHDNALLEVKKTYNYDIRTIKTTLDRQRENERYALKERAFDEAQQKKGMDWAALLPAALENFFDALYGIKEIKGSQYNATLKVLEENKRATATKPKPVNPGSAFEGMIK